MTLLKLKEIIFNGVKDNLTKFQVINITTIYNWIKTGLKYKECPVNNSNYIKIVRDADGNRFIDGKKVN